MTCDKHGCRTDGKNIIYPLLILSVEERTSVLAFGGVACVKRTLHNGKLTDFHTGAKRLEMMSDQGSLINLVWVMRCPWPVAVGRELGQKLEQEKK